MRDGHVWTMNWFYMWMNWPKGKFIVWHALIISVWLLRQGITEKLIFYPKKMLWDLALFEFSITNLSMFC